MTTNINDYPAEKARQGVIMLTKPWERVIFFGGLASAVLLLALLMFLPGGAH